VRSLFESVHVGSLTLANQVIHYVHTRPVISELWPELRMTPQQVDQLADHVLDFSIISVKELARRTR
jgi:CecR-like transcriptional dual regulator